MFAHNDMAVFCSSLTSWFPGMLLTYFLNASEIVPVALFLAFSYSLDVRRDKKRLRVAVIFKDISVLLSPEVTLKTTLSIEADNNTRKLLSDTR